MPLVFIPVSSMVVVLVVTAFSVREFPVSMILVEISTFSIVAATVGFATILIFPVITAIGTFFPVLTVLAVLLFFVSPLSANPEAVPE